MACIALLFAYIEVLGRLDIIFIFLYFYIIFYIIFISWALENTEIKYVVKFLSFTFLPFLFQLFLRKLQLLDFWSSLILQFYLGLPQRQLTWAAYNMLLWMARKCIFWMWLIKQLRVFLPIDIPQRNCSFSLKMPPKECWL